METSKITRNHSGHRCGACHQMAKLTSVQVAEMRTEHAKGGCTYQYLATKFKCGISTVRDIVLYRTRWNG